MKKAVVIGLAAFGLMIAQGAAVESTVEISHGVASTYRGAVNEALISALEQHCGITLSTEQHAQLVARQQSVDGQAKSEINESISGELKKWAQGRIAGYTVLSEKYDAALGGYCVDVQVKFQGIYQVGLPEGNRRRMAVSTFRPEGQTYSLCGQNRGTVEWSKELATKLGERLTQSRKFTMLDRDFVKEVDAELAMLTRGNVAPTEVARLNQKLGTDYLLVGSVKFYPIAAPRTNPLTGQLIPMGSQPFVEVSYRVLLAPTGQLKWADTIRLDAVDFPAASISEFESQTAEAAAAKIASGLLSSLLPFEIVGKTSAGAVVIGEGGKSLSIGERLTAYVVGEAVRDSRTGEVIDRLETAVGTVEVTEVREKLSYARIVEGDAAKIVVGSRLRRPQVLPSSRMAPAPSALNTAVQIGPNGAVVLPF